MKKLLIHLSLFIIPISFASAQTDFRIGYVITLENDTIHGEINYRSNSKNYQTCVFKKDNNITEYTPRQITGFRYVNDKCFTSGVVDGVFVEVLVKGELSLYRHETTYFVHKTGDQLYKLEFKETEVDVNGGIGVKKDTKWKGIIAYLISDCNRNPEVAKTLSFGEKFLTKVVVDYNKCKDSKYIAYKENKPWIRTELGVSIGLTNSLIKTTPHTGNYIYMDKKYTSTDASGGLMFGASFPRITEKFGFFTELYFTHSQYSALVSMGSSYRMEYHDTFISLSTLSIPFALRYSLIERKYSVQVLSGVNYDYHIKSRAKVISEVVSEGNVQTTEKTAMAIRPGQLGFWEGLRIGRSFKSFHSSIIIRYLQMNSINRDSELSTKTNKLSVSLILSKK